MESDYYDVIDDGNASKEYIDNKEIIVGNEKIVKDENIKYVKKLKTNKLNKHYRGERW